MAFKKNDTKIKSLLNNFGLKEVSTARLYLTDHLPEKDTKNFEENISSNFKNLEQLLQGRQISQTHLSHNEQKDLKLAQKVLEKIESKKHPTCKKVSA